MLTLPALHACRLAGAQRLTVLGTPASWGFIKSSHDSLRVRDFSSMEWLGLFSPDAALGPSAQAALAKTDTAIVYLQDADSVEAALKKTGIKTILRISPPTQSDRGSAHAARRLLEPLSAFLSGKLCEETLEISAAKDDPFLALDEEERVRALGSLGLDAAPAGGFAAIHPGSGGKSKCWPAEKFARLAVKLSCEFGRTPLVFFGPADDLAQEEFEAAMPPGVMWEAVKQRPLREVLALLSFAEWFIGNDSGMSHLAARLCGTLTIFGPTDPEVWAPLGRNVQVLRAPEGKLAHLNVDDVAASLQNL